MRTRMMRAATVACALTMVGCTAEVGSEAAGLSASWERVSAGATVSVRGPLADARFPLRAELVPDLAAQLGAQTALTECRVVSSRFQCDGLPEVPVSVTSATASGATFEVAAFPNYVDFVDFYLENTPEVAAAGEDPEEPEPEPRPECERRAWCEGTTRHVITQDCLWISNPDDYRCGGGDDDDDEGGEEDELRIISP